MDTLARAGCGCERRTIWNLLEAGNIAADSNVQQYYSFFARIAYTYIDDQQNSARCELFVETTH
jgi:hypothetical protein